MVIHRDFTWMLGIISTIMGSLLAYIAWDAITWAPASADTTLNIFSFHENDFPSAKNLEKIREVRFYYESVSEENLERLQKMPNLEILHWNPIVEGSFPRTILLKLGRFPRLKEMYLPPNQILSCDLEKLQRQMPNVKIYCEPIVQNESVDPKTKNSKKDSLIKN